MTDERKVKQTRLILCVAIIIANIMIFLLTEKLTELYYMIGTLGTFAFYVLSKTVQSFKFKDTIEYVSKENDNEIVDSAQSEKSE